MEEHLQVIQAMFSHHVSSTKRMRLESQLCERSSLEEVNAIIRINHELLPCIPPDREFITKNFASDSKSSPQVRSANVVIDSSGARIVSKQFVDWYCSVTINPKRAGQRVASLRFEGLPVFLAIPPLCSTFLTDQAPNATQ